MFPPISPDAAYWVTVGWLTVLGGAIGSFLNVVVYRLPLGMSLVYPPSRCPTCKQDIRWFDNVPVFGWIMLRGRCRNCRSPISIRYPTVEAFTAIMFGLVAAIEFAQGEAMAPTTPPVWVSYAYHAILLCTLLCAGLIEIDCQRPPLRLYLPALVAGIIMPLYWPTLRSQFTCWDLPPMVTGSIDGLFALFAGGVLAVVTVYVGSLRAPATMRQRHRRGVAERAGVILGLISVALLLGLPAGAVLGTAALVAELALMLVGRTWGGLRVPPSLLLFIATLAGILAWTWLATLWQPC